MQSSPPASPSQAVTISLSQEVMSQIKMPSHEGSQVRVVPSASQLEPLA